MIRRAVVGEFEDVRLDAVADEEFGETRALFSKTPVPWLAVGEDDFFRELCHCDQVPIILWALRVCDAPQALLVSGAVRESVADETLWATRDAPREKRLEAKLKWQAKRLGYELVPIELKAA